MDWLDTEKLHELYRKISILIRITEHDGLPVMMLEMLGRGRWVIYSNVYPHTEYATNLETARLTLQRCLSKTGVNQDGINHIKANFSPEKQYAHIKSIYQ